MMCDGTTFSSSTTGYLFTYYHARISDERKAQIERVNDQVWGTADGHVIRGTLARHT